MKKTAILIGIITITLFWGFENICAQNGLIKDFKSANEKNDFIKAEKVISKYLERKYDTLNVNYRISLADFFSMELNNQFNPIKSCKLLNEITCNDFTVKDLGIYIKGTTDCEIFLQTRKDLYAKLYFDIVYKSQNIDSLRHFILFFKNTKSYLNYTDTITEKLSGFEFEYCKTTKSKSNLIQFIKEFPKSSHCLIAKNLIEEIDYNNSLSENSLKAYNSFLSTYPNTNKKDIILSKIEELSYIQALKENSIKSYNKFIESYPTSSRKDEIIELKNNLIFNVKAIPLEQNYQLIEPFNEGLAVFTNLDKKGFINELGKTIIPEKYNDAQSFNRGLACVSLNDKWGSIDKTGVEVIPLLYNYSYSHQDGLARVMLNDKFIYIDSTGSDINSIKYDRAGDFHEGLAYVSINDKVGFIDKSGKIIISLKYDFREDSYFNEGLANVGLNDKFGFIDKTGKVVIPLKYDLAFGFNQGFAPVKIKDFWNFIDTSGKLLFPNFKYNYMKGFNEGLAGVGIGGKYGFIDKTGKEVVPLKYDWVDNFNEGMAKVQLNNKWGYVNKLGTEIIPLKYDEVSDFKEGIAKVKLAYRYGLIDKTGKEIIPIEYNLIQDSYAWADTTYIGYYVVNYNDKWFIMTMNVKSKSYFNQEVFQNYLSSGMNRIAKMFPKENEILNKKQKTEELTFLNKLNGIYPYEVKLLDNPILKKRLMNMIGNDYAYIKSIWETQTPIKIEDGIFFSQAMQAHSGGNPSASIVVDLNNDVIYVGIRRNGKVEFYSEDGSKSPKNLSAWGNDYY